MLENAKDHDCRLLLSGLFPETIADLRRTFAVYLPPEKIHIWQAAHPVAELLPENHWRCRTAELVREQALAELRQTWCMSPVYLKALAITQSVVLLPTVQCAT